MTEHLKYIELLKDDASSIIKRIQESEDSTIKVSPSEFPVLEIFPEGYANKIESVSISLSGCSVEGVDTLVCLFHRRDKTEMDQDAFGFYVNQDSQSPSLSGCMLYHGDWDGRTTDINLAKKALEALPDNIPTPLEEGPSSILNGHVKMNEMILKMKKLIEEKNA